MDQQRLLRTVADRHGGLPAAPDIVGPGRVVLPHTSRDKVLGVKERMFPPLCLALPDPCGACAGPGCRRYAIGLLGERRTSWLASVVRVVLRPLRLAWNAA